MTIKFGKIQATFAVGCGKCRIAYDTAHDARSKSEAGRLFRTAGWEFTRFRGWICPDCATDSEPRTAAKGNVSNERSA